MSQNLMGHRPLGYQEYPYISYTLSCVYYNDTSLNTQAAPCFFLVTAVIMKHAIKYD